MSNIELATSILKTLWNLGVRDVVVCAGARNAPFVALLSVDNPFHVHAFFEERSAAFFALGKMRATSRPVAVITTSGTAAAELLPATIEADYQGLPLILVTADRPRGMRASGAPQTINQVGLYSHYVETSRDIEGHWHDDLSPLAPRPIHLNVCFDEPLIDAPARSFSFPEVTLPSTPPEANKFLSTPMKRPLILVSGLPAQERESVLSVLKSWGRPICLEAPSGLREHPQLRQFAVRGGEKSLARLDYDGVIRIGGIPTLRLWRDLEKLEVPVLHFSHLPFTGLSREGVVSSLSSVKNLQATFEPWSESEREQDRAQAQRNLSLLAQFPLSEPAWFHWLSRAIPQNARVFIGNSLPIREWDFAAAVDGQREIFANRGVNGIDGLISTFLGLATVEKSNWCVVGDLSALYDLSGLWPARDGAIADLNLVIVNNGGGKIFHRLFHNPLFENTHGLNFKAWAEMWDWEYVRLDEPRELKPATRPRIIEIIPNAEASEKFWNAWEQNL